jgi:hypothetical protein
MWKAIWWKDWRETGWFVIAAAVLTWIPIMQHCLNWQGWYDTSIARFFYWGRSVYGPEVIVLDAFVGEPPPLTAGYAFGALAIGLGLWQSMGESWRQTSLFLLHRPVTKTGVCLAKWTYGITWLTAILFIGLFIGLWATARPGLRAAPVDMIALIAWWQPSFSWTLLYSGAFLTGIRPASWWGSRLFPLAATVLPVLVGTAALVERWWWCGLVTLIVIGLHLALLWLSVKQCEARDYP